MMAHELPLALDHKKPVKEPGSKTNRHKPLNLGATERRLPNGEKVDFGNSNSQKSKKKNNSKNSSDDEKSTPSLPNGEKVQFRNSNSKSRGKTEQSLPNGAKPDFGNEKPAKKSNGSKKKPALPNGQKPVFLDDDTTKMKKSSSKSKPGEETYAGSSFHSSPAALNLPKPSFKSSPKSGNASTVAAPNPVSPIQYQQAQSPAPTPVPVQGPVNYLPQAGIPRVGPMGPPQYPVTSYPNGNVGFTYTHAPNGFVNFQYPSAPPHPHPFSNTINNNFTGYPPMYYPQPPQPPAPQQQGGQKISFNDLLSSSKN